MQTDRTLSRCALALIQIWASAATATSFAHCDGCPHDSRPYPGVVELPRLRPRRAFWQVRTMIAQAFLPVTVILYSFFDCVYASGTCSFLQVLSADSRPFIPYLKSLILTHILQSDKIKDEDTRIVGSQELGRANLWGCPTAWYTSHETSGPSGQQAGGEPPGVLACSDADLERD